MIIYEQTTKGYKLLSIIIHDSETSFVTPKPIQNNINLKNDIVINNSSLHYDMDKEKWILTVGSVIEVVDVQTLSYPPKIAFLGSEIGLILSTEIRGGRPLFRVEYGKMTTSYLEIPKSLGDFFVHIFNKVKELHLPQEHFILEVPLRIVKEFRRIPTNDGVLDLSSYNVCMYIESGESIIGICDRNKCVYITMDELFTFTSYCAGRGKKCIMI